MNEVAQFPSRLRAYETAAAWLARLDRGVSAEEQAEFQRWLEREPEGRRAFVELAMLWDEAQVLSSLAGVFPLTRRSATPRGRWVRAGWIGAGTAAAATVLALALLLGGHPSTPAARRNAAAPPRFAAVFRTGIGEHTTQDLPDGSMVTMNTDTALEVAFTAETRVVHLRRGEALFEVAHDVSHPFDVHAGGHVVRAVGTAFDVRLDSGGGVQVVVTAGKVRVARAEASGEGAPGAYPASGAPRLAVVETTLVKGEAAALAGLATSTDSAPQVTRLGPSDIDVKLAWQRGMLIFRGERLENVLAEFRRYTTLRFVLADHSLAGVRVGGYFRAGDVDGLLTALRENFHIESERVGIDRVVLHEAPQ